MKKIVAISLIGLCFMSCAYKSVTCNYGFDNITAPSKKKASVRMRIPAGYKYWLMYGTGQEADCYIYPDSSVIYVTNDEIFNPNADNIQLLNDTVYKFRFWRYMYNRALYAMIGLADQVPEYGGDLHGRDSNGLYWRDIFKEGAAYRDVYFGYARVPEDKKEIYDKVIESARFKSKRETNFLFRRWSIMRKPYPYSKHKRLRK